MRWGIVRTIFFKELTETLRDRRTLFMLLVLPVLLYPILLVGITKVAKTQSAARAARRSVVAVWGDVPAAVLSSSETLDLRPGLGLPPDLGADLAAGRIAVPPPPPPEPLEPRDPLSEPEAPKVDGSDPLVLVARAAIAGDVDVVVVGWPGLSDSIVAGDLGHVRVYHDSVDEDSRHARERVLRVLAAARDALVEERIGRRALPAGFADALRVGTRNVAPDERRAGQRLGSILPMVLIIMSLMGGFYASVDLTAGEKERGTMQTLLCAPILPAEIIAGKFLTVWVMTVLAGMMNVVSIAGTMWRVVPGPMIGIDPQVFGYVFLLFLPVSFTTSAVFLAVGAFARDFKDGQNFITPVYLLMSLPTAFTMLPGVEPSAEMAFVPILNVALLIKGLLVGEATADLVFLTVLSSSVYCGLALLLAARVFTREQVLLGGKESLLATLGLERREGQTPSAGMALTFYAVVTVVIFYGSLLLERRGMAFVLAGNTIGLMLLPTLAWVLLFGLDRRETLALRRPSARAVAASVLIGASAWAVIAGLVMPLLPDVPESLSEGLEKLLRLDGQGGLGMALLLVAVAPGVCEELMFRGLILSGLKKLGPWKGVIIAALLFGLAHASIYRLAPTALLGLLFGFLVLRSGSIFVAMLAHALNNAIATVLVHHPELAKHVGMSEDATRLPWGITIGAVVVCAAGVWLASTDTPRDGAK